MAFVYVLLYAFGNLNFKRQRNSSESIYRYSIWSRKSNSPLMLQMHRSDDSTYEFVYERLVSVRNMSVSIVIELSISTTNIAVFCSTLNWINHSCSSSMISREMFISFLEFCFCFSLFVLSFNIHAFRFKSNKATRNTTSIPIMPILNRLHFVILEFVICMENKRQKLFRIFFNTTIRLQKWIKLFLTKIF